MKVLTISIAAYNVEKTLERALDSCLLPELLDDLEIIVVNDGSTDRTLEIAQKYVERFPQTVRVIDKENGGYGTTVNSSMQAATGRYFRLLDGDDRLDEAGLINLVDFLRTTEVDWVYAERILEAPDGATVEADDERLALCGRVITSPTELALLKPCMWQSSFRTELIKEHPFSLPPRLLYTDSLFVANLIPFIHSAAVLDVPLYHYYVHASAGQSTDKRVYAAHAEDLEHHQARMIEIGRTHYSGKPSPLLAKRIAITHGVAHFALMLLPKSKQNKERIIRLDEEVVAYDPSILDIYESGNESRVMRRTNYLLYGLFKLRKKNRL